MGVLSEVGVDTAVTSLSVGEVVSITKVLTDKVLELLALSVTITLQLYDPSPRALKVIVLLEADAEELELLHPPEYVMVPASFELKV